MSLTRRTDARFRLATLCSLFSCLVLALGCVKKVKHPGPAESTTCSYVARKEFGGEFSELQPWTGCLSREKNGEYEINRDHLERMIFTTHGLAEVLTKEGWHYVTRDGRSALVHTSDNGPDYFSEGRTRAIRDSKMGFVDHDLSWRVQPVYDGAMPFREGRALVCVDCKTIRQGEYSELIGGRWGYVDAEGNEVVPVAFDFEQLPVQ